MANAINEIQLEIASLIKKLSQANRSLIEFEKNFEDKKANVFKSIESALGFVGTEGLKKYQDAITNYAEGVFSFDNYTEYMQQNFAGLGLGKENFPIVSKQTLDALKQNFTSFATERQNVESIETSLTLAKETLRNLVESAQAAGQISQQQAQNALTNASALQQNLQSAGNFLKTNWLPVTLALLTILLIAFSVYNANTNKKAT